MDLLEATIKSIKSYYEDNAFGETNKLKEMKYTRKYFDDFEKETFGEKEAKAGPKESKIDPEKKDTLDKMMTQQGVQDEANKMSKDGGDGEELQ